MNGIHLLFALAVACIWRGSHAREPQFNCTKVKNSYLFSPANGVNQRLSMGENDQGCGKKLNVWNCLKELINNYDPDNDAIDFDKFTQKYAECSLREYFGVTPWWVELSGNRSELRNAGLTRMRIDLKVGVTDYDTGELTENKMENPETMLVKWLDNGDSENYVKSQLIENVIRVTSETITTTNAFKTSQTFGVGPDEVKDEDKKKFLEKNKGKKLSIKKGWETAKRKFREKARETMDILEGKKPLPDEDEDEEGTTGKGEMTKYKSVSDTTATTTTTARMQTFEDTVVVPPKRSAKIVWTSQSREVDLAWQTDVFVKGWIAVGARIATRDVWFLPVGDMAGYFHEFFTYQSSTSMSFTARGIHKKTRAHQMAIDVYEMPLRTSSGGCFPK